MSGAIGTICIYRGCRTCSSRRHRGPEIGCHGVVRYRSYGTRSCHIRRPPAFYDPPGDQWNGPTSPILTVSSGGTGADPAGSNFGSAAKASGFRPSRATCSPISATSSSGTATGVVPMPRMPPAIDHHAQRTVGRLDDARDAAEDRLCLDRFQHVAVRQVADAHRLRGTPPAAYACPRQDQRQGRDYMPLNQFSPRSSQKPFVYTLVTSIEVTHFGFLNPSLVAVRSRSG